MRSRLHSSAAAAALVLLLAAATTPRLAAAFDCTKIQAGDTIGDVVSNCTANTEIGCDRGVTLDLSPSFGGDIKDFLANKETIKCHFMIKGSDISTLNFKVLKRLGLAAGEPALTLVNNRQLTTIALPILEKLEGEARILGNWQLDATVTPSVKLTGEIQGEGECHTAADPSEIMTPENWTDLKQCTKVIGNLHIDATTGTGTFKNPKQIKEITGCLNITDSEIPDLHFLNLTMTKKDNLCKSKIEKNPMLVISSSAEAMLRIHDKDITIERLVCISENFYTPKATEKCALVDGDLVLNSAFTETAINLPQDFELAGCIKIVGTGLQNIDFLQKIKKTGGATATSRSCKGQPPPELKDNTNLVLSAQDVSTLRGLFNGIEISGQRFECTKAEFDTHDQQAACSKVTEGLVFDSSTDLSANFKGLKSIDGQLSIDSSKGTVNLAALETIKSAAAPALVLTSVNLEATSLERLTKIEATTSTTPLVQLTQVRLSKIAWTQLVAAVGGRKDLIQDDMTPCSGSGWSDPAFQFACHKVSDSLVLAGLDDAQLAALNLADLQEIAGRLTVETNTFSRLDFPANLSIANPSTEPAITIRENPNLATIGFGAQMLLGGTGAEYHISFKENAAYTMDKTTEDLLKQNKWKHDYVTGGAGSPSSSGKGPSSSKSGQDAEEEESSKGGLVGGVVGGLLGLVVIGGAIGTFVFIRRKRQQKEAKKAEDMDEDTSDKQGTEQTTSGPAKGKAAKTAAAPKAAEKGGKKENSKKSKNAENPPSTEKKKKSNIAQKSKSTEKSKSAEKSAQKSAANKKSNLKNAKNAKKNGKKGKKEPAAKEEKPWECKAMKLTKQNVQIMGYSKGPVNCQMSQEDAEEALNHPKPVEHIAQLHCWYNEKQKYQLVIVVKSDKEKKDEKGEEGEKEEKGRSKAGATRRRRSRRKKKALSGWRITKLTFETSDGEKGKEVLYLAAEGEKSSNSRKKLAERKVTVAPEKIGLTFVGFHKLPHYHMTKEDRNQLYSSPSSKTKLYIRTDAGELVERIVTNVTLVRTTGVAGSGGELFKTGETGEVGVLAGSGEQFETLLEEHAWSEDEDSDEDEEE